MNQEPRIRYTRVRKVKDLVRANDGDAGLDFFFPEDLTLQELLDKQPTNMKFSLIFHLEPYPGEMGPIEYVLGETKAFHSNIGYHPVTKDIFKRKVVGIRLKPNSRVLIPSGIRVLLEPKPSMLMAANKSGISTQTGLIFGAEIVDSPYVGEVHISLINTSDIQVELKAGNKLVQFIHVPIYQTEPEEIPNSLYDTLAKNWGTRGAQGFGSSDGAGGDDKLSLDDELALRDASYSN